MLLERGASAPTSRRVGGAGLFRLDSVYFQNRQADLEDTVVNLVLTMIIANFISKTKNTFANAFAPSFALAHA